MYSNVHYLPWLLVVCSLCSHVWRNATTLCSLLVIYLQPQDLSTKHPLNMSTVAFLSFFLFFKDKVKSFRAALQEEEQASKQINPKRPRALWNGPLLLMDPPNLTAVTYSCYEMVAVRTQLLESVKTFEVSVEMSSFSFTWMTFSVLCETLQWCLQNASRPDSTAQPCRVQSCEALCLKCFIYSNCEFYVLEIFAIFFNNEVKLWTLKTSLFPFNYVQFCFKDQLCSFKLCLRACTPHQWLYITSLLETAVLTSSHSVPWWRRLDPKCPFWSTALINDIPYLSM